MQLHEMIPCFERDLGVPASGTIKDKVDAAVRTLGIDVTGMNLMQQATVCYTTLYGSGTGNSAGAAEGDVGDQVDDDLAMALAMSASMSQDNSQPPEAVPMGIPVEYTDLSNDTPMSAAESHELLECPICFDALCEQKCAVFATATGKRVCTHAMHLNCAKELTTKTCPICRTGFDMCREVPHIEDNPDGWFACCDIDGNGRIERAQALAMLLTQLPLDPVAFERELIAKWQSLRVTQDGSPTLTRFEFLKPGGLVDFAKSHLPNANGANADGGVTDRRGPIPDITTQRDAWFTYFDEDGRGLRDTEVVRGLIKTYQLSSDLEHVRAIRKMVESVWPIFCPANTPYITREAFKQADGLADAIVANIDASARPGGSGSALPPLPQRHPSPLELPDNIKQCPACGMLIEKISGDHQVMCGCEARPAGGTYQKALAGGGCGHEFNFETLAPLGTGKPGEPANERQRFFRR